MFTNLASVATFISLMLIAVVAAYGQKNDCVLETDVAGRKNVVCRISETNPIPLGPVRIPNDRRTVVRITDKSPFDECTLAEIKLTEIKESDPFATILQLFTQAATGSKLATAGGAMVSPVAPATLAERLLADTATLASDLDTGITNSDTIINGTPMTPPILKPLLATANGFVAAPPRTAASFTISATPVILALDAEVARAENSALPTSTVAFEQLLIKSRVRYEAILQQVQAISSDPKAADVIRTLSIVAVKLAAFKANYESIAAAGALLKTVLKVLKTTQAAIAAAPLAAAGSNLDPFSQDLALLPYSQQSASTSVSCTNSISKKIAMPQVPITFRFKSDPGLSVSVGPLLSTTAKQKLGTTQISTGSNSSGAPTFRSEFAVVDRASYQIVPFVFVNYRVLEFGRSSNPVKPPNFSLHFSAGFGVNPNSGSNEVEYFVGPSIGFKNYLIQFGDHIGRFQEGFSGGFNIGDTVPASFPSSLPIRKVYKHGFGIAFTYRLPL